MDDKRPSSETSVEGTKQISKTLQEIIVRLQDQPILLFGIAVMLIAIVGILVTPFVQSIPHLTWFPYTLLIFGLVLVVVSSFVSKSDVVATVDKLDTTSNQLIVFSTQDQTTELRATENGLECYVFDIRPDRRSGHRWTIPVEELRDIDIRIYASNENPDWGCFAIGQQHYDWYYSKDLFKREKSLYDAIRDLSERSIRLGSNNSQRI